MALFVQEGLLIPDDIRVPDLGKQLDLIVGVYFVLLLQLAEGYSFEGILFVGIYMDCFLNDPERALAKLPHHNVVHERHPYVISL